ncbi:MAG: TIR domain-containing protein [Clostridia bacterium]|nr:TIR domain-containing protein [Clostridia bacterium]
MRKKAFISFDYDHDEELKVALVGQAKNPDSPFSINDMSIKEAITSNWKYYARQRIRKCDVVIVICGRYTNTATGVSAELTIAQEEGVPYFLLCGRADGNVVKPRGALSTDKIYTWSWENLKLLINGKR